ncbi:thiaminase /4-amino-5-aminomethyl-2-methylpyrimidine deaminase [Haloactinopolyspora alba]|uniref:Thiaminase /4-amino-5-aminomethyl-2-methylpyrimidine deaminase n=1 Tax=Haloactinopolyspora alba TaxID=648780 RepID=A0A2P8E970_9ACTN|nr:TenA family protein [Haloactinopolyspora alba]PSL06023.1 thiaminase /4-amino-5-aminomethyl-2-methylpyrimidine deaminase [Haloactinopolyspora alba]
MTFSAEAWERAAPWYDAILAHPFVRELGAGTLDRGIFLRYIVDDAHYLSRYSRALATTAARWPDPAGSAVIARFAAGAVEAERELHKTLLDDAGRDVDDLAAEPTPTCLAYVNTLQSDASLAPVAVSLAGLLPCFRIYNEVGQQLAGVLAEQPEHPYAAWLSMYGDPAFAEDTRRAETLADEHLDADPGAHAAMHDAYARAVRFEWMFWDASWRGESWPDAAGAA